MLLPLTDEKFKLCHEELHRERTYISNRLTWYVTSQAFLTTAFAAGLDKTGHSWFSGGLVPFLGGILSFLTTAAITRARGEVDKLKRREEALVGRCQLEEAFGEHWRDDPMLLAKLLPPIFGLAWILMAILFWAFQR